MNKKKMVSTQLDAELHTQLKIAAALLDISLTDVLERCVHTYFEHNQHMRRAIATVQQEVGEHTYA